MLTTAPLVSPARPASVAAGRRGAGDLELICADTDAEIDGIRRFRRATFERRSALAVDDPFDLDRRSWLFALRRDERVVATARVTRLPDPDSGLSQFDHPAAVDHGRHAEVGRLAVAPDESPTLLLLILGHGARWMLDDSDAPDYVSYCHPRLVPLYERVGATDLRVTARRSGSTRPYRFVAGRFDDAADLALDRLGRRHTTVAIRTGRGVRRVPA